MIEAAPDLEAHHHHHHHRTGRYFLDVVLGVAVVGISLISLFIALENGEAMRRLVKANSWPFVSVGVSNRTEDGADMFGLLIRNKGVGPAKIQTLEVSYLGKPLPDYTTLIHTILGPTAKDLHVAVAGGDIVGDVLSSKESLFFLTVKDKNIPPEDLKKLAYETRNIGMRVCYCSVFDECWVLDRMNDVSPPKPVRVCPAPKVPLHAWGSG